MNNEVNVSQAADNPNGVSFVALLAMVIGSTVASAVFAFPGDFAAAGAGIGAVMVGWLVTGFGMLALCLAFYYLSKMKPELKGGIYSYAYAGFGSYVGFNSAWGYWLSELLSNIAFLTLLFSALGRLFPLFGAGNNIPSIIGQSLIWWITFTLVMRGTKEATTVNIVSTIAKLLPIMVLIVAIIFARAFSLKTFMANLSGMELGMSFGKQVMATTTTTVWAFTGIEGAVVISGRAKKASDVGRSTVIGYLSVLVLYIIISILSAGIMTNEELAALGNPPLASILERVVGPWGATFVNVAVIISLLGATLGHAIMCVECPYEAANSGSFCEAFTRTNERGAPKFALILTSIILQIFLILSYFNASTFQVFYYFATGMIMIPYFLSAWYFCKVSLTQDNTFIKALGIFNAVYACWMVIAAGWKVLIVTVFLYVPGIFVYAKGQKEKGRKLFESTFDLLLFAALAVLLLVAVFLVARGVINPLAG
ncbi:MAG: amino acid permease [Eubacterium sp.]|nr:amino acid permease [Eubacterium sp.]